MSRSAWASLFVGVIVLFSLRLPCAAIIVGSAEVEDFVDHSALHPLRAPMLDRVGQLGRRRSGSAVYLGKKWILTANHAFQGRSSNVVVFSGKEYKLRPSGAVRLKNPGGAGLAGRTDLVMVPLRSAPDMPPLRLNEVTPFTGEQVVLVGYGESAFRRKEPPILTDSQNREPSVVLPISGEPVEKPGSEPELRWGENEIANRNMVVGIPGQTAQTRAFVTIRQPGSTECNAQGATGDSGGGVFVKRGERWELSGIMLSVIWRDDLDASGTFIADLSVYREQIAATIPEPSSGLLLMTGVLVCLRRRRS